MDAIWQDMKYALRTLAKRPGFTLVALLTLAVGIGANTAIFSMIHAVLLAPLPYPESGRLVSVHDIQTQLAAAPASFPEFDDWRRHGSRVFDAVGAYFEDVVTLTGDGDPQRLDAVRVSAGLGRLLGLKPAAGRLFADADESVDAARVAIVTHDLWQRQFGGDPSLVGRSLRMNGDSVEIVGVLADEAGARIPDDLFTGVAHDVWLPLRLDEERAPRGLHFLSIVGRLRPGLTAATAGPELEALAERLQEDGRTRHGIGARNLREVLTGDTRLPLFLLSGAVGLVLLIGCANVANLLLARASARFREIAVRQALGASRWRLVRQLVTESLLLAVTGGLLGTVLAWWGLRSLATADLEQLPRAELLTVDAAVLAFALGLSLVTALLFGLTPALQATAGRIAASFREAGRQAGPGLGRQRTRSALVVAEVALSLMLLIGAGLLIRSFRGLNGQELGFEPSRVLSFRLYLPYTQYPENGDRIAFYDRVLERVQALAGVEAAGLVNNLPVTGGPNGSFAVEGLELADDDTPPVEKRRVSPDYFRALGIPLLRGRFFAAGDRADSPQVAIVNAEFARRYLADQDPVGRRLDFEWDNEGLAEIVGVVGDVRHQGLEQDYRPAMYVPFAQNPQSSMIFAVRSAQDPETLTEAIRREVLAVDPDQAMARVATLDEVIAGSLTQRRLVTRMLGAFAAAALLLAVLGIYGVISFSAAQRTHEMGIRLALGARAWGVLGLVMGWGMKLTLAGAVLGLAAAYGLSRYLSSLLFGVTATDPLTFAAVVAILLAAALAACYLPARRASRVDPVVALTGD
jgi:putative ABC transport system permease protein